jgi:hypothetical protein
MVEKVTEKHRRMRSRGWALLMLLFAGLWATPALANNEDFLTQQVCLDSGGIPTSGDPGVLGGCPGGGHRHLLPGEPLPYHKIDMLGAQISDSFPILDAFGSSKAVQTYYFLNDALADPRFPNDMPHFNPTHGGYNIIGSNAGWMYFRGTFDQSGGWQPWWTSNCQAQGWLLAPNTTAALTYGVAASPTKMYPQCPGTVGVVASSVEWDHHNYTYATLKTLDTLVSFHFASDGTNGYWGPLEAVYLTKEYGVTRFEAWAPDTGQSAPNLTAACPYVSNTATIHGIAYKMMDCRDWSTVVPASTPWDPDGRSPVDANVLTWPVDPLYDGVNLLLNTHAGGPYVNNGSPACDIAYWQRDNTVATLDWAWDGDANSPFNTVSTTGNCTLRWSTPGPIVASTGARLFQTANIAAGSGGSYNFGAMLWAPFLENGTSVEVEVKLEQATCNGGALPSTSMTATVSNIPATFAKDAWINIHACSLKLSFYPKSIGTVHEVAGAWIKPMDVNNNGLPECTGGSGQPVICQ